MGRVFVTRRLPFWDEVRGPLLEAGHEVVVAESNGPIERKRLEAEVAGGYDALLTLLTDRIDDDLLARDTAGSLKMIANYAVGYDNVDVEACKRRNIMVTNTPSDMVSESVAEHAWALMLTLTRRITEANDFMRNAAYRGWEPDIFVGRDMAGKTLGIVGMGRIGGMVARRARGFGMRVLYYNRRRLEESAEKEMEVEFRGDLGRLLSESDYVSLHVPLTPETRRLINRDNLTEFKKTAYLVNTARGPVVDEAEVVEALRSGALAGYGADVYENEPNPHPELLQMENVVMTPHIASATEAARRDMGRIAVANLVEGLGGRIPPNLVK